MTARPVLRRLGPALLAGALLLGAGGQGPLRWVDEEGTVHYAARRDQVPERYRGQLGPPAPGESRLRITPNAGGRAAVPHGCILRLRGTERQRGRSYSYADCDACRAALRDLGEADRRRAECFASSVADELGKRSR